MSTTKQAKPTATKVEKGNSGKEPKLHQVAEWRKKPRENPSSVWASSPLANEKTVYDYDSGSIIGQIGLERSYADGFVED